MSDVAVVVVVAALPLGGLLFEPGGMRSPQDWCSKWIALDSDCGMREK